MDFQLETLHVSQIRGMDFSWMKEAMPERWKKAHRFLREEDRLLCLGAGFLEIFYIGQVHCSKVQRLDLKGKEKEARGFGKGEERKETKNLQLKGITK